MSLYCEFFKILAEMNEWERVGNKVFVFFIQGFTYTKLENNQFKSVDNMNQLDN